MGNDSDSGRRKFMVVGIYAISGAVAAVSGVALARFAIGPSFRQELSRWVEIQPLDTLKESAGFTRVVLEYETKDAWLTVNTRKLVYVRRISNDRVIAVSAGCTHLGCIVTWDEDQEIFKCPCHDGRFDADGRAISGPPRTPLKRHGAKIENGRIFLATEPVPPGDDESERA